MFVLHCVYCNSLRNFRVCWGTKRENNIKINKNVGEADKSDFMDRMEKEVSEWDRKGQNGKMTLKRNLQLKRKSSTLNGSPKKQQFLICFILVTPTSYC